jgi:hypothetical protein
MTALSIADCQLPIGGFIASLQIVACRILIGALWQCIN